MKVWISLMLGGTVVTGLCLSAQVLPPNASGVSAAHEHLIVTDQAASTAFWTALGGIEMFPWLVK